MDTIVNRKNASLIASQVLNKYDSPDKINEDDPAIQMLRKWFKTRNYNKKVRKPDDYYTFDLKKAQKLLDAGKFKKDIAAELDIGEYILNDRIKKGLLNDDLWIKKIDNRMPKYQLMYDRRILMVGTTHQIREQMNYSRDDIDRLNHRKLGEHLEKIR